METRKTIIVAILIIIFGFIAPYVSSGMLGPIWFFWIGFFIILFISLKKRKNPTYIGARIGFIFHLVGSILIILSFYLLRFIHLPNSYFLSTILYWCSAIFTPVSRFLNFVYPFPIVRLSEEASQFSISYTRGGISSFFDAIFYIVVGFLIGMAASRKENFQNNY